MIGPQAEIIKSFLFFIFEFHDRPPFFEDGSYMFVFKNTNFVLNDIKYISMELRHLRYFLAVAEDGGMHKAARRLNISQPPLSLSIRQLENEIGARLFNRVGRHLEITRSGEDFLVYARKTLSDAEAAKERARQIAAGRRGIIRLGFISSGVTGILQRAVAHFRKIAPDVMLDIKQSVNGRLGRQVEDGEFDLALIRWPEYLPKGLSEHRLTKEGWMAAFPARHIFVHQASVTLDQLAKQDLVFYPRYNNPAGYDDVVSLFAAAIFRRILYKRRLSR